MLCGGGSKTTTCNHGNCTWFPSCFHSCIHSTCSPSFPSTSRRQGATISNLRGGEIENGGGRVAGEKKKSLLTRNLIYCPGDSGLHNIIPKSISSLRGYYGLLQAAKVVAELLPPSLVFHLAQMSFTSDLGCQVGKKSRCRTWNWSSSQDWSAKNDFLGSHLGLRGLFHSVRSSQDCAS